MPLSQTEAVMLAASKITVTPFSESMLVVRAWQLNKKGLGLKGFEDYYPDCNKVRCLIVGVRGMIKRGLLDKPFPSFYTVTTAGMNYAKKIEESISADNQTHS